MQPIVSSATNSQQQTAYQQSQKVKDGLRSFNGHIDTVANQDYVFCLSLPVAVQIQFLTIKTSGGTLTAAFKIGATVGTGVVITGMSAIAVTSAIQIVNFTAADGTNQGALTNALLFTASANAAALNLDWSLAYWPA